jgi:hypothetical protein
MLTEQTTLATVPASVDAGWDGRRTAVTFVEKVRTELGYMAEVDVNLADLFDGRQVVTATSLPRLLQDVMQTIKWVKTTNWVKKKVVMAILTVAIRDNVDNGPLTETLIALVPILIDTFVEIANAKTLFKVESASCFRLCR